MSTPANTSNADALSDIVIPPTLSAIRLVRRLFGDLDGTELAQWSDLIAALRTVPAEVQDEYLLPLLQRLFDGLGLDPTSAVDRHKAAMYAPIFTDAAQFGTKALYEASAQMEKEKTRSRKHVINPGSAVFI